MGSHQGNGKCEVTGESLRTALAKGRTLTPKYNWVELLRSVVREWNATPGPTGMSPNHIVFGNDIPIPAPPYPEPTPAMDAEQWVQHREDLEAKGRSLLEAIEVGKDSKGSSILSDFTGDRLQLYPALSGPRVSLNYTQDLLREQVIADTVPDYDVEKIERHRVSKDGVLEFDTRWVGYNRSHNTWVPVEQFVPHVNSPWRTYVMKNKLNIDITKHIGEARK